MTYPETIDYLYTKLPMFSRIGAAAYRKDLTNIRRLCDFLGNPQQKFPSIHVAGTNGKGSVSHMLASILQTAGNITGLYTSPHLKDFRERVKINGEMISKEFVTEFTQRIEPLIVEIEPSFFEITVAMAFELFASLKIDVAVIETGLGGRFDSTNIITPELSVITNIGWDHMNILGNTLEKIAFEKAGIIKEGVPVVIGEILPDTEKVFKEVSSAKNAPLVVATENRHPVNWHWEKHELVVEVAESHHTDHQLYRLDLPGIYQTRNLITALEVCSQLQQRGWDISEGQLKSGLEHTKKMTGLHGRWEVISTNPMVVLDVAHNEDGIRLLMEQVEISDYNHLHIVVGLVKDKDINRIMALFPKLADYYFTSANIPRALPGALLRERGKEFGLSGESYSDVNAALTAARARASKQDLILVCGSIFVVGEVTAI